MLDIGIERFSSPFVLMPKYSARIPHDIIKEQAVLSDNPGEEEEGVQQPFVFGEWLVRMQSMNAEWQGFVLPDRSNRYRNESGEICYHAPEAADPA